MKCCNCKENLIGKWKKKFCSQSCAAKFNNVARTKMKNVLCYICNKEFLISEKNKNKKNKCSNCPKQERKIKTNKSLYVNCKECKTLFISKANRKYCSVFCKTQSVKKYHKICKKCNIEYKAETKKSKFCSRSCRSLFLELHTYAHNKSGLSRSKIEKYVEDRLLTDFSDLKIIFNDKNTIGSELDIYIPELRMAFELNGVFHYIPIYGKDTLEKIQNRDKNKNIICEQIGIELITINLGDCNFSKTYAKYIYQQIFKLIDQNKNRLKWAV
jgi:hypothetical protein